MTDNDATQTRQDDANDELRAMSGYPHTLRPELHKTLEDAGIDYWVAQGLTFWNCEDGRECVAYGYQTDDGPKLAVKIVGFTSPAQVIAATLGAGTCHVKAAKKIGDLFGFSLSCGHSMVNPFNDRPDYCPWCGAKVVDE